MAKEMQNSTGEAIKEKDLLEEMQIALQDVFAAKMVLCEKYMFMIFPNNQSFKLVITEVKK